MEDKDCGIYGKMSVVVLGVNVFDHDDKKYEDT